MAPPAPICPSPMLASPGAMPTNLEDFAFEVKWDGYRLIAMSAGGQLRLCSRSGLDLLPRFPELAPLATVLAEGTAIDGELVAIDERGRAGFSALQTRMPGPQGRASQRRWQPQRWRISFMAFDVLQLRGKSLLATPWSERRAVLEGLDLSGPAWACPPAVANGPRLLAEVARAEGEGIIAKRRASLYQPGRRSREWLKIKLARHQEFVIGGYWHGGRDGQLGSLLLGTYGGEGEAAGKAGDRRLRYVGKVGTGFSSADRVHLRRLLDRLAQPVSPFADLASAAAVVWCRPELVAEIDYAEWTHEAHLRHARFMGLRADKPAGGVLSAPVDADKG